MAKAADLFTASIETLCGFYSDKEWDKLYKYVTDVANINEAPARPCRQRCLPSKLSAEINVVVLETTDFRETMTASNDHKI